MAGGAVGFDFFQLGAAVPDFADDYGAFHFCPGGRAGERMLQTPDVRVPGAEVEVKIVLAIALAVVRRGGLLRRWR